MELKNPERTIALRSIMTNILNMFSVAGQDKQVFIEGVNNLKFQDIEDSCQYQAAMEWNCDYLLTFNTKDYQGVKGLKVMSPQDFIKLHVSSKK